MSPNRIALEFNQTRSCPELTIWEAQIDGQVVFFVANGERIARQLYLHAQHAREGGDQSFRRIADAVLSRPWPPQMERVTFGILSHIIYAAIDLEGR